MNPEQSRPFVPSFDREDVAQAFALVLRDAFAIDPAVRRRIARDCGVSEEQVAKWARGSGDPMPGLMSFLFALDRVDGWRDFRAKLHLESDTIVTATSRAVTALECAEDLVKRHPNSHELDLAIAKVISALGIIKQLLEALTALQQSRLDGSGAARVVDLPEREKRA